MGKLKDKVAIVTGASSGIGKSCALELAKEGVKVVIASRNIKKCQDVVDMITDIGGEAYAVSVDISQYDQVCNMVRKTIKQFGRIDILINNAGVVDDAFFEKMTCEQWKRVIDINLNGTFFCTKEVVPYMVQRKYGKIINIASISGQRGAKTQANYAASKAGIIGLTLTLAQELGAKGINVNAVAPGLIETEMVENIPDKIKENTVKKIPVGRFGKPEEIASVIKMLVSDDAAYCNGMICEVNGGICI